jgi:hypothetical protein
MKVTTLSDRTICPQVIWSTTELHTIRHILHKFLTERYVKGENFKTLACYNGKVKEKTVHKYLLS